jgi:hypothetical protein
LGLICFCNLRNHVAIGRIHIGKLLLATHELTINVIED